MNKKGQDLSISTIVIAAIAVVVLVVLIAIFTGRLGIFSSTLSGVGSAEKAKDAVLYNCIPIDKYYVDITNDIDNTKGAKDTKDSTLRDTCSNYKNSDLCKTPCQWVG